MRSIDITLEKLQITKTALARGLGVDPAQITRWSQKSAGLIPQKYHRKLMDMAKELKKPLTWKDLSAC